MRPTMTLQIIEKIIFSQKSLLKKNNQENKQIVKKKKSKIIKPHPQVSMEIRTTSPDYRLIL